MTEQNFDLKFDRQCFAILPNQYVGSWVNPEGISLRVFQYLDLETFDLCKCFIPNSEFGIMFKNFVKGKKINIKENSVYKLSFLTDDSDRENLVAVEIVKPLTLDLPEILN